MLETIEHQVAYVPLHHIVLQKEFRFRLMDEKKLAALQNSLTKSGQTHPLLIEEIEPSEYRIVDGHLRFDALYEIKKAGGSWEKVLSQILPAGQCSALDRFQLLRQKNMEGENPFGLYERACFFKKSFQDGVSIKTIANETGYSSHLVEDHIELSAARLPLAELINASSLNATFALMLHHRYEAWLQTSYAEQANSIASRVLDHAALEKHTTKSWRFLLDFYWNKNRPFLSGRRFRT